MANINNTVDSLVSQVRSQLDEDNQNAIKTVQDILPALNRAQDDAMNILARHYEIPLVRYFDLDLESGRQEYRIPEDAFEDRIEKIEVSITNNHFEEIPSISYKDLTAYESSLRTVVPSYWAQVGKKIRFVPKPSGVFNARVWYLQCPNQLVLSQGRITHVNEDNNYILVDSVGDDLTTESDNLDSYVNLIDGHTGEIKASLQIKRLEDNRITFKSTPTRNSVLGKTMNNDISSLKDNDGMKVTIEPDDFICSISGSCVPSFSKPTNNFLIQFAVAELTRKLGGPADLEQRVLKEFEEKVERSWVGREQTRRIKKRARYWNRGRRRFLYSEGTFGSGNE